MTTDNSPKKTSSPSKSQAAGEDGFVRLHITPLDSELLKIVVPAAVLPSARNISFHRLETFPDKRFGFVELPTADADKLKKKLNGAVLKGSKMRIEKARPEKKVEIVEEDKASKKKKKSKKSTDDDEVETKKRKRDFDVVDGITLHDRKVKRGWTEPLDYKKKTKKDKESKGKDKDLKRKQQKSKYTEKEECLFKAKLPANVASMTPKKEDEDEDNSTKKRKKKGSSRDVTVHEFENTTKFPSFLKNTVPAKTGKEAVEFVDGKGWVDVNGNVVETVKEKVKPKPAPKKAKKVKVVEESSDDSTSSSGSSSESSSESDSSSDEEPEEESDDEMIDATTPAVPVKTKATSAKTEPEPTPAKIKDTKPQAADDTSDSDSSSSSDAEDSSSPAKNLTINIPPPPITPSAKAVHPLEALYKRNAEAEATTPAAGFSFFGGGDDIIEDDAPSTQTPAVPMTPFTRQDLEWRNVRSAAPTPDTAHPPRMQNFWANNDDDNADWQYADEDEAEEAYDDDVPGTSATSDFQKWFWENRGDLNRSWMTRRKTAAKEKRHRDNKARASKAV